MGVKQKLKKIIQIILSIIKKLSKKMKKYYYIVILVCLIIGGFSFYKRVENFDEDEPEETTETEITQQQALDKLGISGIIKDIKTDGDMSIPDNADMESSAITMNIFKKDNVKGEIKIFDKVCSDKDKNNNLEEQLEQEKNKWFFQRWF